MAAGVAQNKKTADELEMSDIKQEGGASDSKAALKEEIKNEIKAEIADKEKDDNEEYVFEVTTSTVLFQVVLMLVTFHYGMVMTNWGDPFVNNDAADFYSNNPLSFGIKTAMFVISLVIYLISQFAACCCREAFED